MSLRQLPEIRADHRMGAAQFDLRPDALDRWKPDVQAAQSGDASISIYEAIGEQWDGSGVTAQRISAILRSIGARDVTVNINSPGGDFFEGVAIYNLLRQHQAKVTVQVMGLAASAASVIAMAGDDVLMGDGAFLMIHNAWAVAIGNRHDLADAVAMLEPFDTAMASLYASHSGMSEADAAALMDAETWLNADTAIARGMATGKLDPSSIASDAPAASNRKALAMVEVSMAKAGYSRATRRDAFKTLFNTGTPSAAAQATPSAGDPTAADALQSLINSLKG